jgi:hypothetical protein
LAGKFPDNYSKYGDEFVGIRYPSKYSKYLKGLPKLPLASASFLAW